MDAQSFLNNFGYIAEAPDGVKRLRELVYYFAITGCLSQYRQDDSISSMIEEHSLKEKESYLKKNKVRSQKRKKVELSQTKISMPERWSLLSTGDLVHLINGRAFKSVDWKTSGLPIIRIQNLNNPDASFNYFQGEVSEKHRIANGDLLLSWSGTPGTSFGAFIWQGGKAVLNQHIFKVIIYSNLLNKEYLKMAINSRLGALIGSARGGVGLKHVTKGQIEALQIPLPPIEEQKRIVTKVDELMALCDKLEAQQQKWQRLFPVLSRTTHSRLVESPTPANLKAIFDEIGTVSPDDLRKTIFSLAVRGKLVSRIPEEPTSREMLNEISLKPISPDGAPNIPNHWNWVTLGSVIEEMNSGWSPACLRYPADLDEWGVLKTTAVQTLEYQEDQNKKLPPTLGPRPKNEVLDGDILITRAGPKNRVGILCVARPTRSKLMISDKIIRFQLTSFVHPDYAALALNADFSNTFLDKLKSGMAESQMNISQPKLRTVPLPIPPQREQLRILRRVDELMIQITRLEKQQKRKKEVAEQYAKYAVIAIVGEKQKHATLVKENGHNYMKNKRERQSKLYEPNEPLLLSTKRFRLRKFAMGSGYRSLQNFDCSYHSAPEKSKEVSPICLVGLNGSGKSNLIEAIAEVFCFLELINLPWEKVKSASSRYRKNRHRFELEYTIEDSQGENLVRVKKTKKGGADFFLVDEEGEELPVKKGRDQLLLLPRRIIGYSSGLNETVSHPFLRTRTMYSEEVRDAAPPLGGNLSDSSPVFDTRTLYMDYESNAAILICNYIFHEDSDLAFFDEFTRVRGVASFGLKFNRRIAGKSKPDNIVRLTSELISYLESFGRCAGKPCNLDEEKHTFTFKLTQKTKKLFRKEFRTAENLFLAMHKWTLLNSLALSSAQRKVFLKEDITNGTLERPPVVPPANRIFNIIDVKILLSAPEMKIDYSGLSDGEHQFIQVFGTVLLFNEPGTLFLFDEPESHFNPEWRTKFNLILNDLPNAKFHEYVISTHSPFVISGSRGSNVYKFTREGAKVHCKPVKFETYGASFNFLLKKLFSIKSMIDISARDELEAIIKRGDMGEMEDAVDCFAESLEKRRLYEALIKKESE